MRKSRMLRKVAIGIVTLSVLVVVIGLVLPRRWHVERTIIINAPPERIHPFIANLRNWQEWAVWSKELDPQVRHTYEGPAEGRGAKWSWLGPKMGRGLIEITAADPKVGVEMTEAIESDTPNGHSSFAYRVEGNGTHLTWLDRGTLPLLLGGYFRSSVEKKLNASFQRGLEALKQRVEAQPAPATPQPTVPVQ